MSLVDAAGWDVLCPDPEEKKPCRKKVTSQNLTALLLLMRRHPDKPVVAMVDSEIVADDTWGRWLGAWGECRLDSYCKGEERVYFYDENDMEDALVEARGWDWLDEASDDECLEAYKALPWIECIVVNIDLPEV